MFGSAILDTAIGLIFVFLVLSLVVSAANELLAALFKWRANNLFLGIRQLLQDPSVTGLVTRFYEHPLIDGLSSKGKKPSYIPSRTFALALLDIVSPTTAGSNRTLEDLEAGLRNFPALYRSRSVCFSMRLDTTLNSLRPNWKLGSIPPWSVFPVGTS